MITRKIFAIALLALLVSIGAVSTESATVNKLLDR